jgi:hypothetical protein
LLVLPDGDAVHLGDAESAVAAMLGRATMTAPQTIEHTHTGERMTRSYEARGARFVLVFEAAESSPEPRVAAIYLR